MIIRTCMDELLHIAELQYGYLEKESEDMLDDKTANAGDKNFTKYNRDMKKISQEKFFQPAPWCDCFCDWCMYKAFGEKKAYDLIHGWSCYTPHSAGFYQEANEWYTEPQRGDQIFFHNQERICHTGFVLKVDDNYVYTIEGNTGDKGMQVERNGGCVNYKHYEISEEKISGYGRPSYPLWHENEYVSELQKALNADFDCNLVIDGIAGEKTQTILNEVVVSTESGQFPNVVRFIQKRLGIQETGIYDKNSLMKLKDFQEESGILKPDGIAGYETLMRLINEGISV